VGLQAASTAPEKDGERHEIKPLRRSHFASQLAAACLLRISSRMSVRKFFRQDGQGHTAKGVAFLLFIRYYAAIPSAARKSGHGEMIFGSQRTGTFRKLILLQRLFMNWASVISNPYLKDLPFKIELNRWGKILMSPASNHHGILQFEAAFYLRSNLPGGRVITECSIRTEDGVKVADVAWASDDFMRRNGTATPYQEAPEICIEVVSPSNSRGEIKEKIQLYLAAGAEEVWICQDDGTVGHFSAEGKRRLSRFTEEAVVLNCK
jgi:Uma2 family endonuclease